MSVPFAQEVDHLKKTLLTMAGHAEALLQKAMKALTDRDDDLAREVKQDDETLDQLEIEIDDLAVRLLAKAPLAFDLRMITVAMKISRDLERVGDEATTIARRSIGLGREPQLKEYVDIPRMAEMGRKMLKDAIDAFIDQAPDNARAIIPRDKEVDALNRRLYQELAGFMVEKPATINRCLHLMTITKSLERIADHATNIAEDVVFLCEGRDIRHQPTSSTIRAGDSST